MFYVIAGISKIDIEKYFKNESNEHMKRIVRH